MTTETDELTLRIRQEMLSSDPWSEKSTIEFARRLRAAWQAEQPVCACGDSFTAEALCHNCVAGKWAAWQGEPVAWRDEKNNLVLLETYAIELGYDGLFVVLGKAIPDSWVPVLYTSPTAPASDARDAKRYRYLRKLHWSDSAMCVATLPKETVQLGTYCPSEEQLDAAIDAAISASEGGKEDGNG